MTGPKCYPLQRAARVPRLESLVVATLVLFGYRTGLNGISDNSTFAHLRTGIEMTRHWSIPRADPYSFTAPHHPWVVQSWLASAVYGAAYRLGGLHVVVFADGLLAAAVAWVVARLARTGAFITTLVAAPLAVLVGAIYWAPRPLMFGLLCLGLLVTVVERRTTPRWLIPITWVWVNTHGSFPLGAAWLLARAAGEALDGRHWPRATARYTGWFLGALALAAANPLGPKLLAFPLAVRDKASVFRNVVEWRSPDFQSPQGIALLVLLGIGLIILIRTRVSWADTLPVVGFLAAALFSVRNVAPAAVVFAPVLGRAMRRAAPPPAEVGEIGTKADLPASKPGVPTDASRRPSLNAVIASLLVVVALIFTVGERRAAPLDLRTYPTAAVAWMGTHGYLDPTRHRVAEQDVIGDYLILLRGPAGKVFIDDRVDMYPVVVSDDYDTLLHGTVGSIAVLDRYRVDTVLWDDRLALPGLREALGGWRAVYPSLSSPSPKGDYWVVLARDPMTPRIASPPG